MPYMVQQLIEGHPRPVAVSSDDAALDALRLMIEHDFSQLPVVESDGRPSGMVTGDSILRALKNFGVGIDALRVNHAMVKAHKYTSEDDLFDLLDDLRDTYAVLIVDGEGKLTGIVTSYDTTEYFRRQAEDMMFVADIESMLKSYIRAAFTLENGDIDQEALQEAIAEITDVELRKKFQGALGRYLYLSGYNNHGIDYENAAQVFKKHFIGKESNKSFDDLTLNEYIQLLLHESKWPYFSAMFLLEQEAVRRLLNSVRDTRNRLFHFRGDITPERRQQLRDSKDWLARCLHTLTPGEYRATTSPEPMDEPAAASDLQLSDAPEEVRGQDESRYALLASYLQESPLSEDKQALTFKQIEEIIREELPASARQHPSWWTNEGMDHNPAQQWLDVGWTVSLIDVIEERVIFTRIKERERAYADFFTVLLSELQQLRPFPIRNPSPSGKSYLVIASVPEAGKRVALLAFSFARYKRFRVELYIDEKEGDKERNKRMFDALYNHKDEIDKDLNEIVHWERIDDKRASRIALYRAGAITDSEEDLAKLRKWAVDAMIGFQKVMEQYVSSVFSIHRCLMFSHKKEF